MTPDVSPYPPPQCKPQDPTRFVLVGASHPGNVGATARAMKVMGFADLVLVAPRWADVLSREETLAFASGATDVLERARIVPPLRQALDGITWACATVMTPRDFGATNFGNHLLYFIREIFQNDVLRQAVAFQGLIQRGARA